jgi:peptidoglycan hydrolase-like protein with peptidoglycan-binding domain
MVVEGGRPDPVVVSHGQQGEPWMGPLSVDLRWPKTFLRYDTTGTGSVAPVGVRDLFWRKPIPMRGHDVDALRIKLGLQGPKQHGGYFGIGTDRAVRQAQRRHGLQVDGVVGEATRRALGL